MSSRLSVAAGLVLGALVAGLLLVLLVAFLPDPGAAEETPPPQLPTASPDGSGGPAATPARPSPAASGGGSVPPASADTAFHIGEPAPSLVVPQLGGGTVDLAALRGRPVWVNFMATWCPPCVDELPRMNAFAARYADEGLVVVAVDVREDEGTVKAFAESLETAFPVALDGDGAAQRQWGAYALPVHYWIDADGVVRDGALGGIGPDAMAESLAKILPGVTVTP
jgi:cytochrome c biogenesis protein CcmG, thiol:disulfide interchange protein DsbE